MTGIEIWRSTLDGNDYGYGPPRTWDGFERSPLERGVWYPADVARARERVVEAARAIRNGGSYGVLTSSVLTQKVVDLDNALADLDAAEGGAVDA